MNKMSTEHYLRYKLENAYKSNEAFKRYDFMEAIPPHELPADAQTKPKVIIPAHLRDEIDRAKPLLEVFTNPVKSYVRSLPKRMWGAYDIAIVVPNRNFVIDQLVHGFIETMAYRENVKIKPRIYNANGNSNFLYSDIIPDLVRHDYDAIYTIGTECSNAIVRFFNHQEMQVPIFFAGVRDPRGLGFETYVKDYVTGIKGTSFAALQAATLRAIKPSAKNVGIIYNPNECGGTTAHIYSEMERLLRSYDMHVLPVKVYNFDEIKAAAETLVSQVDTLMTLADNMMLKATPILFPICNEAKVTLCVPELEAINQGAALAYGCSAYPTGAAVAEKMGAFLRDRIPVKYIQITQGREKFYFIVNSKTRFKQGLPLTAEQLITLEHGYVSE